MRDIFEAADAVHSAAMSHMDGSRCDDNDESHVGVDVTPLGSVLRPGDACGSPTTSVEVDQEGDHPVHFSKPSYFPFCMYHGVHGNAQSDLPSSMYCLALKLHTDNRPSSSPYVFFYCGTYTHCLEDQPCFPKLTPPRS